MTKKLESEILFFLRERNWHKPFPVDVAKSICIEAAELLELFQWGAVSIAQVRRDKKLLALVQKELADVFIYGLVMAVSLQLETKGIIREKLEHVRRKYPAKLMRAAGPERNVAYHTIKAGYRRMAKI